MKKFKELLIEAYEQAGAEKAQRQTIILSLVLFGMLMCFIWGDTSPESPNARMVAIMIIMFVFGGIILVMRLLFFASPISKVKIKNIRRKFSKLYFEEVSKLEERKNNIKKNIKLLMEKQISTGELLNEKLHDLEMLLDYQKTLDETTEDIKAGRYMSLKKSLKLAYICLGGIAYLDSEDNLNAAIDEYSQKINLIKTRLKEEEDRFSRTDDELQLFCQEVSPYVTISAVSPDINSYIR